MQSSMVLSAEELATGEINSQNEVWVKPGKCFAVPVSIQTANTMLLWEFSSQPKVGISTQAFRGKRPKEGNDLFNETLNSGQVRVFNVHIQRQETKGRKEGNDLFNDTLN